MSGNDRVPTEKVVEYCGELKDSLLDDGIRQAVDSMITPPVEEQQMPEGATEQVERCEQLQLARDMFGESKNPGDRREAAKCNQEGLTANLFACAAIETAHESDQGKPLNEVVQENCDQLELASSMGIPMNTNMQRRNDICKNGKGR